MQTHFKIMITLGLVLTSLCFAGETKKENSATRGPANSDIPYDKNVTVTKIAMGDGFAGEKWVDSDQNVVCYLSHTTGNASIFCLKR